MNNNTVDSPAHTDDRPSWGGGDRISLSGMRRQLIQNEHRFVVLDGKVDLFVAITRDGNLQTRQEHLMRLEADEIILPLQKPAETDLKLRVVAEGAPIATIAPVARSEITKAALEGWVAKLSAALARDARGRDLNTFADLLEVRLSPGQRWRAPSDGLCWMAVSSGIARLWGADPEYGADAPAVPVTAGAWVEAGPDGCNLSLLDAVDAAQMWPAIDCFSESGGNALHAQLQRSEELERARLVDRRTLAARMRTAALKRLGALATGAFDRTPVDIGDQSDLMKASRAVAAAAGARLVNLSMPHTRDQGMRAVAMFVHASRLRFRRTLLRGEWWKTDVGPLLAWHGDQINPVALVRGHSSYTLLDPGAGVRRKVTRALASELALDAITFYPVLPSEPQRFGDLVRFAIPRGTADTVRLCLSACLIGILSLTMPLIVEVLVNSAIPRSEFDQLGFCTVALGVTAVAMSFVQAVLGMGMLRTEALVDLRLQSAIIDRLLRLPTAAFRISNIGDLTNRALGIDAARRILTGHTLSSLFAGILCWFSIGLMFFYDLKLALLALGLLLLRAFSILIMSVVRMRHEKRFRDLAGKTDGFVLQLISGIAKLRVAAATPRAFSMWAKQYADQKEPFLASQRAANGLAVSEAILPVLATMLVFGALWTWRSPLLLNLGGFLAFFAAFGQAMAYIGVFAAGLSGALVAIPLLSRIRPITERQLETSDDTKPPGELSGAFEVSGLTFRYIPGGLPVLDDIRLTISPGEYVAVVGPSGSGKSSLFRLLLGFEVPESGTIFYDGKALNTLDLTAIRAQIGIVLQTGQLTSGTIYENICGGAQLPLEEAWAAARLVGLEEDIQAMPMGMHTFIAEGINAFSGGQRQRIMLARAIARRPRILFLDEATSALDNRAQAIVQSTLERLKITRIVIAHRLSTVRQAERIVVLVGGRVVQQGRYSELIEAPGTFRDFAQRQLL